MVAVGHDAAAGPDDAAAGAGQDMVPRRRVPLHRRAAAHIDVGLARGDEAELHRRGGGAERADRELAQAGLGRLVAVAPADERDEVSGRRRPDLDRRPVERIAARRDRRRLRGRPGNPDLLQRRRGDRRGDRPARRDERDVDAVLALAVQEVSRAVERVDEKEEVARQDRVGGLLGDDGHLRPGLGEAAHDQLLGGEIGRRRRAAVGFGPELAPLLEALQQASGLERDVAEAERDPVPGLLVEPHALPCALRPGPILDRFRKASMPAIRERPFTGFGRSRRARRSNSPSEALSEPI